MPDAARSWYRDGNEVQLNEAFICGNGFSIDFSPLCTMHSSFHGGSYSHSADDIIQYILKLLVLHFASGETGN